jgi:hypothetical protein
MSCTAVRVVLCPFGGFAHWCVDLVLLCLADGVSGQSVVSLLVVTAQLEFQNSQKNTSVIHCNTLNLTNYFYSIQVFRFSVGVYCSCIVLG